MAEVRFCSSFHCVQNLNSGFLLGGLGMEKNQKICCSVTSCKYNNLENRCQLAEIQVSPIQDCDTQKADESMCASYEYEK